MPQCIRLLSEFLARISKPSSKSGKLNRFKGRNPSRGFSAA
jgi:hypothetical protein